MLQLCCSLQSSSYIYHLHVTFKCCVTAVKAKKIHTNTKSDKQPNILTKYLISAAVNIIKHNSLHTQRVAYALLFN